VLDRPTGRFLFGTPFAKQTWAEGLTELGRPIRRAEIDRTEEVMSTAGNVVFAGSYEGYFYPLDAESSKELWHIYLGAPAAAPPCRRLLSAICRTAAPRDDVVGARGVYHRVGRGTVARNGSANSINERGTVSAEQPARRRRDRSREK